jgi:hypothetical protein
MTSFKLNIDLSSEDLHLLSQVNYKIIVAKTSSGGQPNVAWQAFQPVLRNTISWEEEYGIYASSTSLQNGAELRKISETEIPAIAGKLYSLQEKGIIESSTGDGNAQVFTLLNQYPTSPGTMVTGLYQNAQVNGIEIAGNAVSAMPVHFKNSIEMQPCPTVHLWISSWPEGSSLTQPGTSTVTQLSFEDGINEITCYFDIRTSKFLLPRRWN